MKHHELKTIQPFFDQVVNGKKKFEARKNDRDFNEGDTLELLEFNGLDQECTGRSISVRVTSILYGGAFGIKKKYCVMSIEII